MFIHPKPKACPDKLYELVKKCFEYKREDRPTFQVITTFLDDLQLAPPPAPEL